MQTITPSPDLYARILDRITYEQQLRKAKRRLYGYGAALAVLMVSFVPFCESLYAQVRDSGLLQFMGLLSTDFSAVVNHAGDFTLSIIEALPVFAAVLVSLTLMGIIFALFKAMRALADVRGINSGLGRLTLR